jgi:hypothetical protein
LRGDCEYWVFAADDPEVSVTATYETRHGTLTAEEEQELHDAVQYDEWPTMEGLHGDTRIADASPIWLTDLSNHVGCISTCNLASYRIASNKTAASLAIATLFDNAGQWVSRLYREAAALGGPVRALVTSASAIFPDYSYQIVPWPLATPLSSLGWDELDSIPLAPYGHVVEGEDANTLRQLRRNQHALMYHPDWLGSFVPVSENGGPLFMLYLRDVIPFEDEDGHATFTVTP